MDLDDSLLPDDPEALKAIIRGQRLENDVLREAVDLVRKDPAADPRRLANREKALIAHRLRATHSPASLASRLNLALSSCHYRHARLGRDRHAWLRPLVHEIFGQAKGRYGSRRIHAAPRAGARGSRRRSCAASWPRRALRVFSQVGFLWLVTYFFRVSAWSVLLVIGCGFPCRT
jgi:hypothetical protein